jgi:hypothetical protein
MRRRRVQGKTVNGSTLKPTEYTRFRVQGSVVEFKRGVSHSTVPCDTPRGIVDGFSAAARLRLLKRIATIDWSGIPMSIFITLTYPDDCAERTYQQRGQDRYLFMRHVEKYLGRKVCGVWRVEWEPRRSGYCKGMILPHYHILLFGVPFVHYKEINKWWKGVLHHDGYVRTEVKRAASPKVAGMYVAKYMSKKTERASLVNAAYLNNPGRHYGYHRASMIPSHLEQWLDNPTDEQVAELTAFANEVLPWLNKHHTGSWTLLGKHADRAREILRRIGLTQ